MFLFRIHSITVTEEIRNSPLACILELVKQSSAVQISDFQTLSHRTLKILVGMLGNTGVELGSEGKAFWKGIPLQAELLHLYLFYIQDDF